MRRRGLFTSNHALAIMASDAFVEKWVARPVAGLLGVSDLALAVGVVTSVHGCGAQLCVRNTGLVPEQANVLAFAQG